MRKVTLIVKVTQAIIRKKLMQTHIFFLSYAEKFDNVLRNENFVSNPQVHNR